MIVFAIIISVVIPVILYAIWTFILKDDSNLVINDEELPPYKKFDITDEHLLPSYAKARREAKPFSWKNEEPLTPDECYYKESPQSTDK